jgi:PIN domain nuclease of toxin-antitoxin system
VAGLLLDTHALIWFVAEAPMEDTALFAIGDAQQANRLFVSPITAWEAALAVRKGDPERRPDLAGDDAASWFRRARQITGARLAPITSAVALEAARVPGVYGSRDPGDCFIIATARVRRFTVVSRDGLMTNLADNRPAYLWLIPC